jgi:hypothetical protein
VAEEKSNKIAVIPNPQMLQLYSEIDPDLPMFIIKAAAEFNSQEYRFAMTMGSFGFIISVIVILSAVYLAMNGHGTVAGTLLTAGMVGVVVGFQYARLSSSTPPSIPTPKAVKKNPKGEYQIEG